MVNPCRNMRFLVLNFWDTPMPLRQNNFRAMTEPASRQTKGNTNRMGRDTALG